MRARLEAVSVALVLALWLGLGAGVAAFTTKVADWFVMTDELLYERLAISIARSGSPMPRIHGETIANINQLYPLVIAPMFRDGSIVNGLHDAHLLNAFVMSSVALPVYLLTRRVTKIPYLAIVVAGASIVVPWITLSSFLLTEVVAYPAFVWGMLAIHVAAARPSARNDVLGVAGVMLAVLARTQFYALALVLPAVIVLHALAHRRLRDTVRAHRVLVAIYVVGALAALLLTATGRGVFGTYAATASGNPLPASILGSMLAHVSVVALAGGLLPFLIGGAWVVSNLGRSEDEERHVFAWLAVIGVVVLTVEVASFNERFGGGEVRERYLFYVTPLLMCALAAALSAARLPRWSVAGPLVLFVVGLTQAGLPTFEKLNVDTPAAILNDWLLTTMHGLDAARLALALAALVAALVYVEAAALLPRRVVTIAVAVLVLAGLTAETGYAFKRLFAVNGTSGLPLTLDQSPVFSWVDRQITPASEAVIVPYPVIRDDYWANVAFWWDLEFWNTSVDREAVVFGNFSGTSPSFPKHEIRFDPETGRSSLDVDSYIAQAANDVRFHLVGRPQTIERDVALVFPDRPWHADWVTYGIYPDGWTRPNNPARVRIFGDGSPPVERTLTFTLLAPGSAPTRRVSLRSNRGRWDVTTGPNALQQAVTVCVPRSGHTDVTLRASGASPISVDQRSATTYGRPRVGGVLIASLGLAGERGAPCVPNS